jgi:CRP-like cAMP-binding protein
MKLLSDTKTIETSTDTTTVTKRTLLRDLPLFAQLTKAEMDRALQFVDVIDVPAGASLTVEGEPAGEAFVIVEGEARVEVGGRVVNTLTAGDVLGETALLDHGPRTATVVTNVASRLLIMDPRGFFSLLALSPTIATEMARQMAARLRSVA